jgi:hypothetical protein
MDTADKESLSYKIPAFGQLVVCALFNEHTWDGEIVPLGNKLPSEEVQKNYLARGLRFLGTLGFVDGRFCCAWECPVPDNVMERLVRAYAEHLYSTLVTHAPTKAAADASVQWLRELAQLPDNRDRSKEN